jgi:hypothetical protein
MMLADYNTADIAFGGDRMRELIRFKCLVKNIEM